MRKLSLFNFISLNGFFQGPEGDLSWHRHGEEENKFSEKALEPGNTLLFGRVTYQMMESYWATPEAFKSSPIVAHGMNNSDKIVFSTTLTQVKWKNSRIISENLIETVKQLKSQPGKDMAILGSGSIATLFAEHGLIDFYQFMLDPVAIPGGVPLFNGITKPLNLKLISSKALNSGVILLNYEPLR